MTEVMDTLREWWGAFADNRWIRAAVIVGLSVIAAKLADWICSGTIAVWARRTATDIDDRLIEYLHRPVFVSAMLIGLAIAIPAIAAYNILRNRVQRLVLEVGITSENLMGRFEKVGKKK